MYYTQMINSYIVGIAFSTVTTALGGFDLIISNPINSTDQSLLMSSKTSNFDLDQQDGVMTLDGARAPVFIADIIDDLSKSTEVAPVLGGYSGVTVCSPLLRTVRVDLMRTSHIVPPPFPKAPIRSPTSLDTERWRHSQVTEIHTVRW
jgi:malate/lactate dehydrogenase